MEAPKKRLTCYWGILIYPLLIESTTKADGFDKRNLVLKDSSSYLKNSGFLFSFPNRLVFRDGRGSSPHSYQLLH